MAIQQVLGSNYGVLLALLPALFALIGSTASGLIRQDGLPPWANSLISVAIVVVAAILNVLVAGKLSSNLTSDGAAIQASANLLLAGGLHTLTPYVTTLQSNVLAVLKPVVAPLAPTQPRLQAMSTPRATTAVMPSVRKVNIVPPTIDNNPHAG